MRFSLLSELRHELRSIWTGYPAYVYSGEAPRQADHVPVFVYHTVEPSAFERELHFLSENGYDPVGMDDLTDHVRGGGALPEKPVVLTFDDARSSFWRYAFPLLEQYEMRAVLFVIPGLTIDAPSVRENLSDAWNGTCAVSDVEAVDADDSTLCTWPELRAMYNSGWIDIESHSLFHREIFVETKITEIVGPDSSFVPYQTSVTAYLTVEDIGRGIAGEAYYGFPVFPTASLHAAKPAVEIPEEVRNVGRQIWQSLPPGERRGSTWKRTVRDRLERCGFRKQLRRQTADEVAEQIENDVVRARDLLRQHVDRNAGAHFCLPYGAGSETTIRIQRALDVKSCSWGILPEHKHNTPGGDPMRIARVKSDFLWRLPGIGQKSVFQIYLDKFQRRVNGEAVY